MIALKYAGDPFDDESRTVLLCLVFSWVSVGSFERIMWHGNCLISVWNFVSSNSVACRSASLVRCSMKIVGCGGVGVVLAKTELGSEKEKKKERRT